MKQAKIYTKASHLGILMFKKKSGIGNHQFMVLLLPHLVQVINGAA
jgi:hypothetical protein